MERFEIPLLRESVPFVTRLIAAAVEFHQPKYFLQRRVNWSYRYEENFYDREAAHFLRDPEAYIAGSCAVPPALSDIYPRRLSARQIAVVLTKILSHQLFAALGKLFDRHIKIAGASIYRKAYVDDIELVFDPHQRGVVRAVYPFPISLGRQLRYLRFLRRSGYLFKLDGNSYALADIMRFMVRRDVSSLMRLERRAQFRKARAVLTLGVGEVQLSDEFDIGSLDFSRYLARHQIRVINSAHGVGKYFPFHCYGEFHVLTIQQKCYYRAVRECRYVLRRLNDSAIGDASVRATGNCATPGQVNLVVLSQRLGNSQGVVESAEAELLDLLRREFAGRPAVKLIYKPHPNRAGMIEVPGFSLLSNLAEVNDHVGTIFVSFFSTCQIDPAFKGRKFLLRAKHIYPEIAFDDSDRILSMPELLEFVRSEAIAIGGSEGVQRAED